MSGINSAVSFNTPEAARRPVAPAMGMLPDGSDPLKATPTFSRFARYASPTPPPSKARFYWDEFKANYRVSQNLGRRRYQQNLREDRHARLKLFTVSAVSGLGFAAFRRLRRSFTYLTLLVLLAKPIMAANRTFPELERAYEQVQQGNPTRGRQTFALALDDSVYSIYQDFMKPLSYGMALGMILGLPAALRGEGADFLNRAVRSVAKLLRVKPTAAPLRLLDTITRPLIHHGDYICNRLRRVLPFIHLLEL